MAHDHRAAPGPAAAGRAAARGRRQARRLDGPRAPQSRPRTPPEPHSHPAPRAAQQGRRGAPEASPAAASWRATPSVSGCVRRSRESLADAAKTHVTHPFGASTTSRSSLEEISQDETFNRRLTGARARLSEIATALQTSTTGSEENQPRTGEELRWAVYNEVKGRRFERTDEEWAPFLRSPARRLEQLLVWPGERAAAAVAADRGVDGRGARPVHGRRGRVPAGVLVRGRARITARGSIGRSPATPGTPPRGRRACPPRRSRRSLGSWPGTRRARTGPSTGWPTTCSASTS